MMLNRLSWLANPIQNTSSELRSLKVDDLIPLLLSPCWSILRIRQIISMSGDRFLLLAAA